jgi:hypothetical protein
LKLLDTGGVSCPSLPLDPATSAQVDAITQVLIGDGTSETSAEVRQGSTRTDSSNPRRAHERG